MGERRRRHRRAGAANRRRSRPPAETSVLGLAACRARQRRFLRVLLGAGRGPGVRRDRPARAARSAPRGAVRRDGGAACVRRAITWGCSSTRYGAPRCRPISSAAPGARMPGAGRFWHCLPAPAKDCPPTGLPSTCRSASCPRPMPRRRRGCRRPTRCLPRCPTPRPTPEPAEPESPLELTHEDQPAIAGTLRTPRRWEWMLVEAAVIGGDPERWRRRLEGFGAELRIRLEESRRADPESSLTQHLERDLARLAHLGGLLPSIGSRDGCMAGARDVGRVAPAIRAARASRASRTGPCLARAGGPAADGGRRAGRARRSPRGAVGAAATGRSGSSGPPLRPGVRRQPDPGAGPRVPGRVRSGRRRARVSAKVAAGSAAARRDARVV